MENVFLFCSRIMLVLRPSQSRHTLLLVLNHHIWAAGAETGQRHRRSNLHAAAAASVHRAIVSPFSAFVSSLLLPSLLFSPRCLFSQLALCRYNVCIHRGPEKTHDTCTDNLTDPKINTQQVYSFKDLTAALIKDLF